MYRKYFKRLLDISASSILLLIATPLMILVSLLLLIFNKGKIFFIQQRPGLNSVPFHIIKFKTMNEKKDPAGNLLPDESRITSLGKVLRHLSLDELPQLINVLKGDLSLVGPRPLLMEYLPLYSSWQKMRHSLKPGITGWAQIHGRNIQSWDERFRLDNYYAEHLSFALDMKILFLTIFKVLKMEDIGESGGTTKEKFTGSDS
jgi:undecaprenyl phosphate N,N'-diacetylbacillosamine 1-phosphate transferase